ncbi:hypothetical protein BGW80DRAFT_567986 [Lactifluus volemus]|nr:hypothetical protein BGW80DRAFT_567986 [Lactifluus volemus]
MHKRKSRSSNSQGSECSTDRVGDASTTPEMATETSRATMCVTSPAPDLATTLRLQAEQLKPWRSRHSDELISARPTLCVNTAFRRFNGTYQQLSSILRCNGGCSERVATTSRHSSAGSPRQRIKRGNSIAAEGALPSRRTGSRIASNLVR